MPKGVPQKQYTGEFKQKVVEEVREGRESLHEIEKKYGISRPLIRHWERLYLEEGAERLYIDRRGRESKGRPPKAMEPGVAEDLIAENQRLRVEVAYLKKLNALVLEEELQNKRRK